MLRNTHALYWPGAVPCSCSHSCLWSCIATLCSAWRLCLSLSLPPASPGERLGSLPMAPQALMDVNSMLGRVRAASGSRLAGRDGSGHSSDHPEAQQVPAAPPAWVHLMSSKPGSCPRATHGSTAIDTQWAAGGTWSAGLAVAQAAQSRV